MNIQTNLTIVLLALLVFGCGPRPDVDTSCEENDSCPQPSIVVSTDRLDFQPWAAQFESRQTLNISNSGDAALTIESIEISGIEPSAFELEGTAPETIAPGATPSDVTIAYTGGRRDGADATLIIKSDDPSSPTARVELVGEPVDNCARTLRADTNKVSFDRILPGGTTSQTVRLESVGSEPFDFWSISGEASEQFYFEFFDASGSQVDRPDTLAPGEFVDVRIVYEPTVYGTYSGSLRIKPSETGCGTFSLPIEIGVDQECVSVDADSRSGFSFEALPPGKSSTQSFWVSNCRTAGRPTGLSISVDQHADQFEITEPSRGWSGRTETLALEYRPTEEGTHDTQLVIESDDPVRPEIRLQITASSSEDACPTTSVEVFHADGGLITSNPARVEVDDRIRLDASSSQAPDGTNEGLEYDWSVTMEPADLARHHATSQLSPGAEWKEWFTRPGVFTYTVQADDPNSFPACNSVEQVIEVAPNAEFYVELLWETPALELGDAGADLDLYMRRPGDAWDGASSVYYDNTQPDWGVQADASDNPEYSGSRTSNMAPETITYPSPEGTVQVGVHDYDQSGTEVTNAIFRAYYKGKVVYERTDLEFQDGDFFTAFEISFSDDNIVILDESSTGVGQE